MADNVSVTPGTGKTIATDEVSDATLGTVQVQYVKLMDGTLDGTAKAGVGANGLSVDIKSGLLPPGAATMSASGPAAIATNQHTLAVAYDTTKMMEGATGSTVSFSGKVKIAITTATTTLVVAGTAGKRIRVVSGYLVCGVANVVTLQSSVSTTNNDGGCSYPANGGIVLPFNPAGWFDTAAGDGLNIVTGASGANGLSGQLSYVLVN